MLVHLKPGHTWPNRKQYALHWEAFLGIAPVIQGLIDQGLIRPCLSACITLILPVKKPSGEYQMVQDLRAVNEATEYIYPVAANPYTLLAILLSTRTWCSVLDLKDAFFCTPLAPESQESFAFEWQDPNMQQKQQYC